VLKVLASFVASAALALVGCADDPQAMGESAALTGSPELVSASSYPIDEELREAVDILGIHERSNRSYIEVQRRISHCMTTAGFSYNKPSPTEPDEWISYYRRKNPLNPDRLEVGYHVAPPVVEEPTQVDDDQFDRVLLDDNGCLDEAVREVGASTTYLDDSAAMIESLNEATITAYFASDVYADSVSMWAHCMSKVGYRYPTPDVAGAVYTGQAEISPEELSIFRADRGCDVEVGLTQQQSKWQQAALASWMKTNEGVVASLRKEAQAFDAALARLETEQL
jgi:hypothetical protein